MVGFRRGWQERQRQSQRPKEVEDLRRGRACAPRDDGTGQLQRGIGAVAVVVEHRRLGGQQLLGRPWFGHGFHSLLVFLPLFRSATAVSVGQWKRLLRVVVSPVAVCVCVCGRQVAKSVEFKATGGGLVSQQIALR